MKQDNQSHMIQSNTVKQQLDRLEEQDSTSEKNKKGSTNEIQPMVTDEGISQ